MAASNGKGKGEGRKPKTRSAPADVYVPCRVEPGMFSGEYLVTFEAADPQDPETMVPVRLLADENEVLIRSGEPEREKPADGLLRVEVVRKAKGFALVVLPQPAQPFGERAYVSEDSLVRSKRGHDPLRSPH